LLSGISHKIKLLPVAGLIFFICFGFSPAKAQYFDINNRKSARIPFRLIRNLVIIQLQINDKGPFNFILDTGVGLMVITEPKLVDSIGVDNKRTIKMPGMGEGDAYEAYVTPPLKIDIPGLKSYDVSAAILKTDHFGLSNFVGIPIHGLLGYEFFNNLAVKLNFADSTITVYKPNDKRSFRKGTKIPLSIEEHKPYIQALVSLPNGTQQQCKLIVDLGAGHPVSLENMIKKHGLPQKFITANLGVGLNGPISGFLSRIDEVDVGKFKIKSVIASFPNDYDEETMKYLPVKRDGNLGVGILKRFTVVFDYQNNAMYLKPNLNYAEPFEHDMSGMEYYAGGEGLKHIIVSRVEPGSPADAVGIEKDDEIVAVNFQSLQKMTLEEVDAIFKSKDERSLLVEVYHDHKYDKVIMTLRRRI
jgi:hypothetical protein